MVGRKTTRPCMMSTPPPTPSPLPPGDQGNCIGPDGASALAEALKSNTSLTRLYIDGAGIKARGACAVASALAVNSVLR